MIVNKKRKLISITFALIFAMAVLFIQSALANTKQRQDDVQVTNDGFVITDAVTDKRDFLYLGGYAVMDGADIPTLEMGEEEVAVVSGKYKVGRLAVLSEQFENAGTTMLGNQSIDGSVSDSSIPHVWALPEGLGILAQFDYYSVEMGSSFALIKNNTVWIDEALFEKEIDDKNTLRMVKNGYLFGGYVSENGEYGHSIERHKLTMYDGALNEVFACVDERLKNGRYVGIYETDDGYLLYGDAIVGSGNSFVPAAIMLKKNGEIEWQYMLSDAKGHLFSDVCKVGNTYTLAASSRSEYQEKSDDKTEGYLVRLNKEGNLLESINLFEKYSLFDPLSVKKIEDGYLVIGNLESENKNAILHFDDYHNLVQTIELSTDTTAKRQTLRLVVSSSGRVNAYGYLTYDAYDESGAKVDQYQSFVQRINL